MRIKLTALALAALLPLSSVQAVESVKQPQPASQQQERKAPSGKRLSKEQRQQMQDMRAPEQQQAMDKRMQKMQKKFEKRGGMHGRDKRGMMHYGHPGDCNFMENCKFSRDQ